MAAALKFKGGIAYAIPPFGLGSLPPARTPQHVRATCPPCVVNARMAAPHGIGPCDYESRRNATNYTTLRLRPARGFGGAAPVRCPKALMAELRSAREVK